MHSDTVDENIDSIRAVSMRVVEYRYTSFLWDPFAVNLDVAEAPRGSLALFDDSVAGRLSDACLL